MSSCGSCLKCADVCRCITLRSSNNTLRITKDGCEWDLKLAEGLNSVISAVFNDTTRQLCIYDRGELQNCVNIPDSDDQYLELENTLLSIKKTNGDIVNSVNLAGIIPAETQFTLLSQSLVVTSGGAYGHNPRVEVVPSSDIGNKLVLGTDGRPYVPPAVTKTVNIVNIQGISFTKTENATSITFTPVLDFAYIASQVCPLCETPAPCIAPTINISNILSTSFTITISGITNAETFDVSVDGGISYILTGQTTNPINVTGLNPNSPYQVIIRKHCANSQITLSTPSSVTTGSVACPAPTNVNVIVS